MLRDAKVVICVGLPLLNPRERMVPARESLKVFVVKQHPASDTADRYMFFRDQILDGSQAHSQNTGTFPLAKEKLDRS
jgi:hypothetical protein